MGAADTTPTPAHVVLMAMPNAPNALGLIGDRQGGPWVKMYRRWSEALWARSPRAVDAAEEELAGQTRTWVETLTREEVGATAPLHRFWNHYLRRMNWTAGLRRIASRQRFAVEEDAPEPIDENWPSEMEPSELSALDDFPVGGDEDLEGRFCFDYRGNSFTATLDSTQVEIRMLSDVWRRRGAVDSIHAQQAATAMLEVLWILEGRPQQPRLDFRDELTSVTVTDEQSTTGTLLLGWRLSARNSLGSIVFRLSSGPVLIPSWLVAFSFGDPRCSLRVHLDGRSYLRIPRELFRHGPWFSVGETRG